MFDAKTNFIDTLLAAKDTVKHSNEGNHNEEGYATYITANGLVIGKTAPVEIFDASSSETVQEYVESLGENRDALTVPNIAYSYYKVNNDEKIDALSLTDVTIKDSNGNVLRTNVFILFADQIIGIIPGKIEF